MLFRSDDPMLVATDPGAIRRVVLASGKVAMEAIAERDARGGIGALPVAIVRLEQLYPWPDQALDQVLARYANAREIVWLQEEPENMGAWNFVKGRLYEPYGDTHAIRRVSRVESASPATGVHAIHVQEQRQLFEDAFAGLS